ncbi:MAG: FAD-dependent oxidoreductase [Desulfomonilaceae bacterium]
MKTLQHLLEPIKIGALDLSNRLVMPPMGTGLGDTCGIVSEANLAYIKRRAQSGAGLIITEITAVHPAGQVSPRALGAWDDKFIPGLSQLAATVHSQSAKVALQLHHCGRESYLLQKKNLALAASAIPSYIFGFLGCPREMTLEQIQEAIAAFGAAAFRAKVAGFDAVELHGAHGYLLMQFLSALSNRRRDLYGGDFKDRSRFMMECIREVRKRVGPDFPVSVRMSGEEGIKGGYSVNDMQTIIPDLVAAGADIIHVSFGTHGNMDVNLNSPNPSAPVEFAPGFNAHLAKKIKEVATVPVISVGRYTDPFLMDEVIARSDADMIAVGRQHLADPDFLKNAIAGYSEDTMECLACNQGCIERLTLEQQPIRCAINPETGQELIRPAGPAKIKRNVWVIGAGPAGLTAAFEAARLGHQVTLYERERRTGGNARYAAMAPHKNVYERYILTVTAKCKRQSVEIKTGVEVTEAMIDEGRPEVVVLATGAAKAACPPEAVGCSVVCDAWQILDGEVQPENHVVIVGGGLIGMETADFLREKGVKDITVVEMLPNSPVIPQAAHGQMLHKRLRAAGITLMFGTTVNRIEERSMLVTRNGEDVKLEPVSQVIIAIGVTPRNALKDMLSKKGIIHFVVGDAVAPRRIIEATTEGANAAWSVE